MKDRFEEPLIEVILLDGRDVKTSSGSGLDQGGGNMGDEDPFG